MKKYEILEHKADLKIRAFGKNKEDLFLNIMLAMTESQKPEIKKSTVPKQGEKAKRELKIKSLDLPALLVDFLSEILYLTQTNKETYNKLKFIKFKDSSASSGQAELEAEVFSQKVERFGEDIKAVTYHNLNIHQNPEGVWETIVLFDI